MKRRGPELDPELESLLGFRRAARRLPEDFRARVLARSRAYLSGQEPTPARVPFEAESPPPSISRHRVREDVRARVLARSFAYLSGEPGSASVLFEEGPPPPSVSQRRAVRWLPIVASVVIAAGAAGAIAALRSRAPNVPLPDSPTTSVVLPPAVHDKTMAPRAPTIVPTRHRNPMPRPHRLLEDPLAEVELLQDAQHAYARGDFSSTLVLVAAHARRFPRGPLAEECDALGVKSLLSSGRGQDARRAGATFAARYPRSVLLPGIEEALDSATKEARPMRQ